MQLGPGFDVDVEDPAVAGRVRAGRHRGGAGLLLRAGRRAGLDLDHARFGAGDDAVGRGLARVPGSTSRTSRSYNETYGAIGGVMVLLLWFYVSGIALLIGAELNAEIEHASPLRQGRRARRCRARRRRSARRRSAPTRSGARTARRRRAAVPRRHQLRPGSSRSPARERMRRERSADRHRRPAAGGAEDRPRRQEDRSTTSAPPRRALLLVLVRRACCPVSFARSVPAGSQASGRSLPPKPQYTGPASVQLRLRDAGGPDWNGTYVDSADVRSTPRRDDRDAPLRRTGT